ncbi:MAG: anion permease [Oscillospiraceae bacterium]|nr:anion permease [Oscillospiraceae bacterium]
MKKLLESFKTEPVLWISGILAFISCLIAPKGGNLLEMLDTDMMAILFCFMLIISGFAENGLLQLISEKLVSKVRSARTLSAVLVAAAFFMSMLITNDVALITIVPFTIMTLSSMPHYIPFVLILQTAAANIGSMATPFGNPQNLFLFSTFDMQASEFFRLTLPISLLGLFLTIIPVFFLENEEYEPSDSKPAVLKHKAYLTLYGILFVLCILSVFGILDTFTTFMSVCIVIFITETELFTKADYSLLLTFAFFFVFVGNIRLIDEVSSFMSEFIMGREFLSSLLLSQVISNVPAAVMLSGFTDRGDALILGTNIGGLGTIIASLASLISYKFYCRTEGAKPLSYLLKFSVLNFSMLIILGLFAYYIIL